MIPDFYTNQPQWPCQIEEIVELVGRIGATEEILGRTPELRRASRIEAVQSTVAIEGSSLTPSQAEAIAEGQEVIAAPREVKELENALNAYDALDELDPWNSKDFLHAHSLLTAGLTEEAGEFRTVDVDIVNPSGEVIHSGSCHAKVPRLVSELLQWGSQSQDHPLVVSSAVHFLIEHIHPFRDGNGRIGRLWQTLVLARWRPTFAWLPTETLIKRNQHRYYRALQASREPEIDAATFIDLMLDVIPEALQNHEQHLRDSGSVGIKGGTNFGIKMEIFNLIRSDPKLTAARVAQVLGKSPRTIERHLSEMVKEGSIRREGSKKTGRWIANGEVNK